MTPTREVQHLMDETSKQALAEEVLLLKRSSKYHFFNMGKRFDSSSRPAGFVKTKEEFDNKLGVNIETWTERT